MVRMDGLAATGLLRGSRFLLGGGKWALILGTHARAGVAWRAKGLGDQPFFNSSNASGPMGSRFILEEAAFASFW